MRAKQSSRTLQSWTRARRALALGVVVLVAAGDAGAADFCACDGLPSLGSLDTNDESNWAAMGVTRDENCSPMNVFVPLPPIPGDGKLVFDNLTVSNARNNGCNARLLFTRGNDTRNVPVTILVKGNVLVAGGDTISVAGAGGGDGQDGSFGAGGVGGHGGFAGGDGAYQIVNFAADGGSGVGPGGGLGSVAVGRTAAGGGTLLSVPELRPLVGGSGGGGGHSTTASFLCSAGGGGGGGGAILIAANGTVTVSGTVTADGGVGGNRRSTTCSSSGAGGSGGAIRILANEIAGGGSITANGGNGGCCSEAGTIGDAGSPGRIRLEAITNTFAANNTSPVAVRAPAPGPIANPITPIVTITGVDGNATPQFPKGFRNQIDLIVDAPGAIQVGLATQDVPEGTDVQLTVKPKVGAPPFAQNVTLGSCAAGACVATVNVDLTPGAYILEARATFQVP